jgi:hypothetical protein
VIEPQLSQAGASIWNLANWVCRSAGLAAGSTDIFTPARSRSVAVAAALIAAIAVVVALIAAAALTTGKRPLQIFGALIAGIMLLNAALVGAAGFWLTETRSAAASAQISRLAETGEAYCIYPDMVQSRIQMMREAGITAHYTPDGDIACSGPEEIAGYGPDRFGGKICPCPE